VTRLSDIEYLKLSCEIAKRSRENGNHPFGCLLVDEEGNVVLEAENTCETERDMTGHAETNLMRMASKQFEPDFLWKCTLYTNIEPCAMCSGAAYWVGVGRIVYGLPENWLLGLTGDHPDNPTMDLGCRKVFESGQRDVEIIGPIWEIEDEVRKVHEGFWNH